MEYWERRWATNQTGWHRQNFNDLLTKHWPNINAAVNGKVLIPLCGKSLDMLWFADIGYNVTGIELAPTAIKEFFADNDMYQNVLTVEIIMSFQVVVSQF